MENDNNGVTVKTAIYHETDFKNVIEEVQQRIDQFLAGPKDRHPDFDDIEDCVYLKNSDRINTCGNRAFKTLFASGVTTVGMATDSFLKSSVAKTSVQTDRLILDGITLLEFEHVGVGSDNKNYQFRTFKRSYQDRLYEPFAILGITRPVALINDSEGLLPENVQKHFLVYKGFTEQEQVICRGIASGLSSKEIAEVLDLSSRAIEIKRKKMMNALHFERPIEIVKMMVRFQERGMVD